MPHLSRARITTVRGTHFNTLGYSSNREVEPSRWAKRLELLPEEALYLIERGSLLCRLDTSSGVPEEDFPPMSAQQAFAAMIGLEGLAIEKYQVGHYAAISFFVLNL